MEKFQEIAKNFLKNPSEVAAIAQSSRYVIKNI